MWGKKYMKTVQKVTKTEFMKNAPTGFKVFCTKIISQLYSPWTLKPLYL